MPDVLRTEVTYTYVVLGTGDVLLTVDARPTDQLQSTVAWLPRMGVAFNVPTAFDRVPDRTALLQSSRAASDRAVEAAVRAP